MFSRQTRPFVSVCAGGCEGTLLSGSGEAAAAGAEKEEGDEDRRRWGRQRGRKRRKIHTNVYVLAFPIYDLTENRIFYQLPLYLKGRFLLKPMGPCGCRPSVKYAYF